MMQPSYSAPGAARSGSPSEGETPTEPSEGLAFVGVTQTICEGPFANCLSACVATLLELDSLDDLPAGLARLGDVAALQAYLADEVGAQLATYDLEPPEGLRCIAVGPGGHAVVWQAGRGMLWDPAPARRGLQGPPVAYSVLVPLDR